MIFPPENGIFSTATVNKLCIIKVYLNLKGRNVICAEHFLFEKLSKQVTFLLDWECLYVQILPSLIPSHPRSQRP